MLKKIFSWAFQNEETESLESTPNTSAKFELILKNQVVGYLSAENGNWIFRYSDWYTDQTKYLPIIDFPQKEEQYVSPELWPFFVSRIPGLKQPSIQQILAKDKVDQHDTVSLLKKFGRQSIQSPMILEALS